MLKQPKLTDDLFEKSSMSFGDHLEELRRSLGKALLWLAVGTSVGLLFATSVVNFISQPLRHKIDDFYVKQSADKYKRINGAEAPKNLLTFMKEQGVMTERVFLDPVQVKGLIEDVANDPAPADKANYNAIYQELDAQSVPRLQPLLLMRPIPNRLNTFDALEGFLIWLKAGLLVGAILGSPGIFYHLWQFLAAGLYPHERRYVYVYMPLSIVLFVSGACLAFFVIFELVIEFLLTYNEGMDIDFTPRLKDYVSFALFLPLGFGIAFQLPMVMLALNRFGVVSVELYISQWRIAILAIAFLSMILTPADAYSMIGMFIPLTVLYFLGIALCKYMPQGPGMGSGAFDPA